MRPEQGLIGLRKALDVYANLPPAVGPGVDLLIVRELVGGLYYGRRGTLSDGTVFDVCEYHPDQVERLARRAFGLAAGRGGRLLSVDKANVLDTSRMWRRVLERARRRLPRGRAGHGLVDSVAMQLVLAPGSFDVIVIENTFGDILSDVAAGVTGGLGLASLGQPLRRRPRHLRAGARLRAGHRRQRGRQSRRDAALARPCCSTTGSASPRSRARSSSRSDRRSRDADPRSSAARRPPRSSAPSSSASSDGGGRRERRLPGPAGKPQPGGVTAARPAR